MTSDFDISPPIQRAARAALGWTVADLAKRSGVSVHTLRAFEQKGPSARLEASAAVVGAFESVGIRFVPRVGGGAGFRFVDRERG